MRRLIRFLVIGAILAMAGYGIWRYRAILRPQAIRDWIASWGSAGPVLYILLYALNTISLFPPVGILSLSAGLAFGPTVGFAVILAGAMLGTSVTFWISRRLGRGFVERRLKGTFRSIDEKLERRGFATVLFFRLIPAVPYEALNYVSGLSKIRFRDYALATFMGILPGTAVAAYFGNSLNEPLSRQFFIGLAALAVLMGVPLLYLKWRRDRRDVTG